MHRGEQLDLIARFEAAADPLVDFVRSRPAAATDFRRALAEARTVREHAVHSLDADTFAHARLGRRFFLRRIFVFREDVARIQAAAAKRLG
jgi:hypothetical protein